MRDEYPGRSGAVLARIQSLHPVLIDLSLSRILALLAKLGHPERALAPIVHVAGTNGKGSTCAFLRAIAEAAGLRVHVMTSPHLVHVVERFRIAGRLVDEDVLVETLAEVERVNDGAPLTVFEMLTATGLVLFSRAPADLVILEVGLGGRFDATNVVDRPCVSVISAIDLDHQVFLGETLVDIAAEKAGIIKSRVPVVCAEQPPEVKAVIDAVAAQRAAPVWHVGHEIRCEPRDEPRGASRGAGGLRYTDPSGTLFLPEPSLWGGHQRANATLAVAALRHAGLSLPPHAYEGVAHATWSARLQRLDGALAKTLPEGWELWLDGGHNPNAGRALAATLATWTDRPLHLIVGMRQSKDVEGFLRPIQGFASTLQAVQEPGQYLALPVHDIIVASNGQAQEGPTLHAALARLKGPRARVLICGSLYLAGLVLRKDQTLPD